MSVKFGKAVLAALAVGAAGVAGAVVSAGCAKTGPREGRVVVALQQEPDLLFSPASSMVYSNNVMSALLSALTTVDEQMNVVPDLAEEVPTIANGGIAADGKTITYRLRPNLAWHDGKPLTSADVRFTWKCVMDAKTQTISRDGFDQIEDVVCPDPRTVVVKLKQPFAPFVAAVFNASSTGNYILPEHILSKSADVNKDPYRRAPVGCGPFIFEQWVTGAYIRCRRNPAYHRGTPAYEQLIFKFIPDENTMFTQLKTGEVDVMQITNSRHVDVAVRIPGVTLHEVASLTWEHLALNCRRGALADRRVRQALAYAVDKAEIRAAVYGGKWDVAETLIPPRLWAHHGEAKRYPFDPARSRKLLDESGWTLGPDGIRKDAKGTKLKLTVSTTAGRKPREDVEVILQRRWREIGIEVDLNNKPGAQLFASHHEGGILQRGDYDVALYAWSMVPDPDLRGILHTDQIPPAGQNTYFWSNPESDRLLEQGRLVMDREARKPIYARFQEIVAEEVPLIPMLYWQETVAARTSIRNVKVNPTGAGHYWNLSEWSPAPK